MSQSLSEIVRAALAKADAEIKIASAPDVSQSLSGGGDTDDFLTQSLGLDDPAPAATTSPAGTEGTPSGGGETAPTLDGQKTASVMDDAAYAIELARACGVGAQVAIKLAEEVQVHQGGDAPAITVAPHADAGPVVPPVKNNLPAHLDGAQGAKTDNTVVVGGLSNNREDYSDPEWTPASKEASLALVQAKVAAAEQLMEAGYMAQAEALLQQAQAAQTKLAEEDEGRPSRLRGAARGALGTGAVLGGAGAATGALAGIAGGHAASKAPLSDKKIVIRAARKAFGPKLPKAVRGALKNPRTALALGLGTVGGAAAGLPAMPVGAIGGAFGAGAGDRKKEAQDPSSPQPNIVGTKTSPFLSTDWAVPSGPTPSTNQGAIDLTRAQARDPQTRTLADLISESPKKDNAVAANVGRDDQLKVSKSLQHDEDFQGRIGAGLLGLQGAALGGGLGAIATDEGPVLLRKYPKSTIAAGALGLGAAGALGGRALGRWGARKQREHDETQAQLIADAMNRGGNK